MEVSRNRIHPFEETLKQGLHDPDIRLLWNQRLGFWVVVLHDKVSRHPCKTHLMGCEGVHYDSRTSPWVWVFSCMMPQADGDKAYTPIEPGLWLLDYLRSLSARTRSDVPTDAKYDGLKWAKWLMDRNDTMDKEAEDKSRQDWVEEIEEDVDRLSRGVVTTYGNLQAKLRSDGD